MIKVNANEMALYIISINYLAIFPLQADKMVSHPTDLCGGICSFPTGNARLQRSPGHNHHLKSWLRDFYDKSI